MSKKNRNDRAVKLNLMKEHKKAERRRTLITWGSIGGVAAILIGLAAWGVINESVSKSDKLVAPMTNVSNVVAEPTEDYGLVLTAKDLDPNTTAETDVNLALYIDFSCPHCKEFEQMFGDTLDQIVSSGWANIEYRVVDFMDSRGAPGKNSEKTAAAALCVYEEEGIVGWNTYHKEIFNNSQVDQGKAYDNRSLMELADDLGLGYDEECIRSEKYAPWVDEATVKFQKDQIGGTPSVFVNGKEVDTSGQAIMDALTEAHGGTLPVPETVVAE